ncbi:hypothetical protein D3C85_1486410 [compost metagenome]
MRIIFKNTTTGTHPQHAFFIFGQTYNNVVANIAKFTFFIFEGFKRIAIKAVQTTSGAYPNHPFFILQNGINRVVG